jgi:hypothetical protein
MQFGITLTVDVAVGDEKPAFIVYAPLSMTNVREGGTGPDDLVRLGAIVGEQFVCCMVLSWVCCLPNV